MLIHRVITALVALPVVIWILYDAGSFLAAGLCFFLSIFSFFEAEVLLQRILFHRSSEVIAVGYDAYCPQAATRKRQILVFGFFLVYFGFTGVFSQLVPLPIALISLFPLLGVLAFVGSDGVESCVKSWIVSVFALAYGVAPWFAIWGLYQEGGGARYIFYLLAVIMMSDTGAYFVGKAMGKRSLALEFSPKKSVEGAIGGVITGVLGGLVVNYLYSESLGPHLFIIVISGALAYLGIIGDLLESALKRAAGVKDSGNFFPGHGGILDRLDSLYVAAPAALILFRLWKSS